MALRLGSLEDDKAVLQLATQMHLNHFECLIDILCFEMMLHHTTGNTSQIVSNKLGW